MTEAATPTSELGPVAALETVFQHVGIHCALDAVSLEVARGELLLLVGRNGAGKTLLTRVLLGLDPPSAGHVRLFGEDLTALGETAMRRLRRRVGAVFQGGTLLDGLSVLENLLLPLRPARRSRANMARAAQLVLAQLQLDGLEHHRPRALSLGQRRRVELARALIHRPELLVWDGLGDGLDRGAVREILEVLRVQQRTRGLTVIATDNSTDVSARSDDRVAVLERGRLLADARFGALEARLAGDLELRVSLAGHPAAQASA